MQEPMLELNLGLFLSFWTTLKSFELTLWLKKESKMKSPHTLILKNQEKLKKKSVATINLAPSFTLSFHGVLREFWEREGFEFFFGEWL